MKSFFKGIKEGNKFFAEAITTLINTVILTIVYILGIGITAMIAKIIGKNFLELNTNNNTYWKDLNIEKKPKEHYYRQF